MKVSALQKNARVAPRKARRWREVVIGRSVEAARQQLAWLPGKPVRLIEKVLNSAVANAVNNFSLEEDKLVVSEVEINEGIKFKRWQPVSRGMAHPFRRESCHIKVVVEDQAVEEGAVKRAKTRITTLTAGNFDKISKEKPAERVADVSDAEKPVHQVGAAQREDKKMEVWKKERMLQKGGNKKQAQRRKSK